MEEKKNPSILLESRQFSQESPLHAIESMKLSRVIIRRQSLEETVPDSLSFEK
jgi:hypothetical protein